MSEPGIHHVGGVPVGAAHAQISLADYDCPPEMWCDLCGAELLSPVLNLEAAVRAWDAHRRECPGDSGDKRAPTARP